VVVPVTFIVPSIFISHTTKMKNNTSLKERLEELMELDESIFLTKFHQSAKQWRKKAWHDRHINKKAFMVGYHVPLYDNKFQKFLGKLEMHWLRPFIVVEIKESGAVKLAQLDEILLPGWVNGAHLK